MAAHRRHAEAIEPAMFDRWLELWADVTDELMPPAAAAAMQAKAAHIADSLKLGLFFRVPPHEPQASRSEEHTSELQSLMRTSYAVFCLKKKNTHNTTDINLTKRRRQYMF